MRPLSGLLALWVASALFGVPTAWAQSSMPSIVVARISSEKACTLYQESAGTSSMVATPYMVAASQSWRTWLVKDCVDNFATIRGSLQAALASTGKFNVKTAGAGYTLSGAISQAGEEGGGVSSTGYSVSSQKMFASMNVTLRDPSGRTVYGGLFTKHMEIGSGSRAQGVETQSGQSGEAIYTELQNQAALAVARLVAFHIVPLKVVSANGKTIQLNYGLPLLALGAIVHVTSPDGATTIRYTVTSAGPEGAAARVDGEVGDWSRIGPDSLASVVEADDPAANERRIEKTDLP
jgi:hypothetical protein